MDTLSQMFSVGRLENTADLYLIPFGTNLLSMFLCLESLLKAKKSGNIHDVKQTQISIIMVFLVLLAVYTNLTEEGYKCLDRYNIMKSILYTFLGIYYALTPLWGFEKKRKL